MNYEDQLIRESTGEYEGRVWCSRCERDDEDCVCYDQGEASKNETKQETK